MPTFTVPSSFGVLREFNTCHAPQSGQFCSGTSSAVSPMNAPRTYAHSTARSSGDRLVPSDSMPPKGKPITLVYGGAFNPPHAGHVAAAREALRLLRAEGYTVTKVVVSPTPDKLLRAKLGDTLYPLAERAKLAELEFGKRLDVEVSTGPGMEAEAMVTKIRRTQLADHVGAKNPRDTIVNITGEDAAVGHPPGFPAVYQGDKGSSHEGYYYLALKRIGGFSSTAIRSAMAEGTPMPAGAMSARTEAAVRALERRRKARAGA